MENKIIRKEWLLKKNCTLSPQQFGGAITFIGGLSLIIGLVWAINGLWFILAFACVECIGLFVAFVAYSKHATDRERVVLTKNEICVEREVGGLTNSFKIPRDWVRARFKKNENEGMIFFKSGKTELKVGQFVSLRKRELFFDEIKGFL